MAFTGVRTQENGTKEEETFDNYQDMIKWLCEDLDAGVAGYENGAAIPQGKLTDDMQAWMS